MQQAIFNTVAREPYVNDFDRLYPSAKHFITYYNEQYGDPIWNSKVVIDPNIELTMQFQIDIDASGHNVTRTSTPDFHILTTDRVETLPDGRKITHHGPGMQFGPTEWKKVVAANGDVSVIFP